MKVHLRHVSTQVYYLQAEQNVGFQKPIVVCKVVRPVAATLIKLIKPKTYRCAGLSPRSPGINPRTNHVSFYVSKVHWDGFVCKYFMIIPLTIHTRSFIYSNWSLLIALLMTNINKLQNNRQISGCSAIRQLKWRANFKKIYSKWDKILNNTEPQHCVS